MGVLQVVSPDAVAIAELDDTRRKIELEEAPKKAVPSLVASIRRQFYTFRNHRSEGGGGSIDQRQLDSLKAYNGKYDNSVLQSINQFGGSKVYSRISTIKCRGATALLRDIFLGASNTWELEPTPIPDLPEDIIANIDQLIAVEIATVAEAGETIDERMVRERRDQLLESAIRASVKTASKEANKATQKLNDILVEGGFYDALRDFITDLPIFLFACIKGPVLHAVEGMQWENGIMEQKRDIKPFWKRVSPFDVYFDGSADDPAHSSVIEKIKLSRSELNSLIGVEGYNDDAIRAVLDEHGRGGLVDWIDTIDAERADLESKENPHINESNMIDTLEYHGSAQGRDLLEYGFTKKQIKDELLDYHITAWIIGEHCIKCQLNPNANHRPPYYITSFEKVPGSMVGHGIPEIISDSQSVANATLRALVNNLSIASGPQVGYNEDLISPSQDGDQLYPWKRWKFLSDPMANNASPPISFFQPKSNAQELLQVYNAMMTIADETSGIPRYMTGSEKVGGAASTASGLSMLINNASKVLQNVAYNIDSDVYKPMLKQLYSFVMLTDEEGILNGDEEIVVRGVEIALQRDTDRVRQLEFLQVTGNEIDMGIIGPNGRAAVLREVADNIGMPGNSIVPSEAELDAKEEQAMLMQQQMQQMATANQNPAPGSGGGLPQDMGANQTQNQQTPSARPRVG